MEDQPMTLEGLRAWKQEYVSDEPTPGEGLPYTADDHIRIVRIFREKGMSIDVEKFAADFGIPREYWEEVVRRVEAEERRKQP